MWVCFVIQSCNLSANQNYIFNCILDLFEDIVKTNTYILTFCDREKTVIIDLLDSKEFILVEIFLILKIFGFINLIIQEYFKKIWIMNLINHFLN